jgi:hypothetical protein
MAGNLHDGGIGCLEHAKKDRMSRQALAPDMSGLQPLAAIAADHDGRDAALDEHHLLDRPMRLDESAVDRQIDRLEPSGQIVENIVGQLPKQGIPDVISCDSGHGSILSVEENNGTSFRLRQGMELYDSDHNEER